MYELFLEPDVHAAREALPGNIRQRMRRLIDQLAFDARPSLSQALDIATLDVPRSVEMRRIRVEHWRIVYAVNDTEQWIWILGVYRRPPYNYANVSELARKLRES